jgi:hypothetical protein
MASLAQARSLELREVLLSLRGVTLGSPPPTSTAWEAGVPLNGTEVKLYSPFATVR